MSHKHSWVPCEQGTSAEVRWQWVCSCGATTETTPEGCEPLPLRTPLFKTPFVPSGEEIHRLLQRVSYEIQWGTTAQQVHAVDDLCSLIDTLMDDDQR